MVLISSAPPRALESLPWKIRHALRSADGTASPAGSPAVEPHSDFAPQAKDSDFPGGRSAKPSDRSQVWRELARTAWFYGSPNRTRRRHSADSLSASTPERISKRRGTSSSADDIRSREAGDQIRCRPYATP